MVTENPCVQCGACCAFFRVSFYWQEVSTSNHEGVPLEFTDKVSDFLQCMKGTDQPQSRCIALQGKIGEKVGCAIYDQRSSTCRDFGLHSENGQLTVDGFNLIRCNQARKAWNLPPLTRTDLRGFSHFLPIRNAAIPIQLAHKQSRHRAK